MKLFRTPMLAIRIIFDNPRYFNGWPAIATSGAVFLNATFDSPGKPPEFHQCNHFVSRASAQESPAPPIQKDEAGPLASSAKPCKCLSTAVPVALQHS